MKTYHTNKINIICLTINAIKERNLRL